MFDGLEGVCLLLVVCCMGVFDLGWYGNYELNGFVVYVKCFVNSTLLHMSLNKAATYSGF